jgi:hypothetical protein
LSNEGQSEKKAQQEQEQQEAFQQALAARKESLPDARGLPVATSSWDCVEKVDIATWDLARWAGDVPQTCTLALTADPGERARASSRPRLTAPTDSARRAAPLPTPLLFLSVSSNEASI